MDNHEHKISALGQAKRELEDALVVMTHLETRQSSLIREQAEYLASHEARLQQQDKRNREVDERIEKLVSAIGG